MPAQDPLTASGCYVQRRLQDDALELKSDPNSSALALAALDAAPDPMGSGGGVGGGGVGSGGGVLKKKKSGGGVKGPGQPAASSAFANFSAVAVPQRAMMPFTHLTQVFRGEALEGWARQRAEDEANDVTTKMPESLCADCFR